jgi:hypothetical protein
MLATIYALVDPRTNYVRYVGWTKNSLKKRLSDHISDARRGIENHKCKWIRKLLSEGFRPSITVLEEIDYYNRADKEKYWISYYGRPNLTNGTDGGEGVAGLIVSDETREKLSLSHMGQKAWNAGISTDTSHLENFQFKKGSTPFNIGVSPSDETKKKISESKSGKSYGKSSRTKGKCFGVTFEKKSCKWIAQIKFENKTFFIGKYEEEFQAGIAYDICSIWISESIRLLNFPEKEKEYSFLLEENNIQNLKELRILIKYFLN